MTDRKFRLTVAAAAFIAAAVLFSAVYAYFNPGIGSRLTRGGRYLALGDGASAAAEFSAVLDRFDFGDPAEMKNDPEKYAPAYLAALGYADAKILTGETGDAEIFLRAFASFGAEAAVRLEMPAAETEPEPAAAEPDPAAVVWKSALLETIVREALSLPEGGVSSRDLDGIYDLCVFGSRYTGINLLSRGGMSDFRSLLARYESERGLYEGYRLTDLSDLKYFKNLQYVLLYDCGAESVPPTETAVKITVIGR